VEPGPQAKDCRGRLLAVVPGVCFVDCFGFHVRPLRESCSQ
jgi:hypothetical protein